MSDDVRKADPVTRRLAWTILVAGLCAGAVVIAASELYRVPLKDWVLADPERARVALLAIAALLLAPLAAFAVCLWWLGQKVLRVREYPPPGLRVIRDTPVLTGEKAISRGRLLKALGAGLVIAAAVLGVLLWRLMWA
jgi:hypothetical protein